jgi:hypothetical protein
MIIEEINKKYRMVWIEDGIPTTIDKNFYNGSILTLLGDPA